MKAPAERSRGDRVVAAVILGAVGLVLAALVRAAVRLPLDTWDGSEYLLNARLIAGHDLKHLVFNYADVRPPLVSLLLAPVMWGYAPAGQGTSLVGAHLVMVAIGAVALAAAYRLFRRVLSPAASACGVALIAVSPLFIHYTPFAWADVTSMALTLVVMIAHLELLEQRRWSWAALLAVALAAAVASKYPLAVLGPALVVSWGVALSLSRDAPHEPAPWGLRTWRRLKAALGDYRWGLALAASGALFYLLHVWLYSHVALATPSVWTHLVDVLKKGSSAAQGAVTDPRDEYVLALWGLATPAVVVLAGLGALMACGRRSRDDVLHLLWFGAFFAVMTFYVPHKEARYLLPVLPSFVFFAATAIEALLALARRSVAASLGVALLALAWPARLGAAELARFDDPVYSRPMLGPLATWLRDRVGVDEPIVALNWTRGGTFWIYTLYPKAPVVLANDEYFHFHHMNQNGLGYIFDRPLRILDLRVDQPGRTRVELGPVYLTVHVDPAIASTLQGDALAIEAFETRGAVMRSSQGWFETASAQYAPEPPLPIEVEAFVRRRFEARPPAEGGVAQYADRAGAVIELRRGDAGWGVVALPSADPWRVYGRATEASAVAPLAAFAAEAPAVIELLASERASFAPR